jgi:hypothetical protein
MNKDYFQFGSLSPRGQAIITPAQAPRSRPRPPGDRRQQLVVVRGPNRPQQRGSMRPPALPRNPRPLGSRVYQDRDRDARPRELGAAVRTQLTRQGISDIRGHRVTWVMGYTYIGDGVSGTADAVYFQTASKTWLVRGFGAASSGQTPILSSDLDLGQVYVADVEKHYARKIVRRMWIHVDSLQSSTQNNMVAVIGVSRGPGAAAVSIPDVLATAPVTPNTVENVTSMKSSFPVDSFEHKTQDITWAIAGGSGPRQNEFELSAAPVNVTGAQAFYKNFGVPSVEEVIGVAPACVAVAGNSTLAALRGTRVHLISIEQEIDLLDYIGGMAAPRPE